MKIRLLITLFFIYAISFSQNELKAYPKNYLPESVEDAISYMNYSWTAEQKESFKNKPEGDAVSGLHFGYGMAIRNGWLRHGNEKLVKSFYDIGIYAYDDMSSIILVSYHRRLHRKEINLKQQTKPFKKYWARIGKQRQKEHNDVFKKFKVGDTLNFKYLRTYISEEQERLDTLKICNAKGVLLEKRKVDFNLKIKLIESCDPNGIYIIDFSRKLKKPEFEIMTANDIRWNFYNDWEPKN